MTDKLEKIKKIFAAEDKFAKHNGVEILEIGLGTAKCAMKVQEHHLNGVKRVHGAAIFTLADLAFAVASNSYGTVAVGVNVNINYIKAAGEGAMLYAEVRECSKNKRLGVYQITITDDSGAVIASFEGLAYRKEDTPLPGLE